MRRLDREHVALVHASREPSPRVRRRISRMRTAVEIDRSLCIVETDARMERENALFQRIDLGSDPHVGQPTHAVVGGMLTTLVLADCGDPICIVTVSAQPRCVVDREAKIVAELRPGQSLGTILVIDGRPLA